MPKVDVGGGGTIGGFMSREDMEAIFAKFLGATHTVWLHHGIAGDDTHGHVDDLARFTDPQTVGFIKQQLEAFAKFIERWGKS